MMSGNSIDSLFHEMRSFSPSDDFRANAVADKTLYDDAKADRLSFWADQARALIH
jgi:acetyl-CoA synthetase